MTRDAAMQDAAGSSAAIIPVSDRPVSKSAAPRSWNTDSLGLRFGVDVASATTAGALICPIITIIDRAIIEKAAKGIPITRTTTSCLRTMVTRPGSFFLTTPFLLIYTLYTTTYLTANAIDTVTSTVRNQPFSTVFPGTAKFVTTTSVNMAICIYKDARFAKIFGPSSPSSSSSSSSSSNPTAAAAAAAATAAKKIPKISYGLFCLRDSVTIFASFNVPALIAPSIPDSFAPSPALKLSVAQFACPALMQFVSTPMHLLGLDLYNRQPPGGLGWRARLARVRRDYVPSSFARMGKIVPAYGVGGVVNTRMRAALMGRLERMAEEGEGEVGRGRVAM